MEARIIIPTSQGERLSYELRIEQRGAGAEVKIVFNTSEEMFERWLFYLLRDVGAHVVCDEPTRFRAALGLGPNEAGVISTTEVHDVAATRHAV